jgi:hypothetical protein
MREDKTVGVYFIVEREIGGRVGKFIEKFADRQFTYVDDAWCLDCALATPRTNGAGTLSFTNLTEVTATVVTTEDNFTPDSINSIIRCDTGRALVVEVIDARTAKVMITNTVPVVPQTNSPKVFAAGSWTLDSPFTVVTGLDHLEGEVVSALGDGAVFSNLTVTNGQVAFPVPVTYAVVGLSFSCRLKTLPPSVVQGIIEDKNKRIIGVAFRHHETRGLKVGAKEEWLDDVKFMAPTVGNAPTPLQSAITEHLIDGSWDYDGQVVFAQDQPLPATILGYVLKMSIGDVAD